MSFSIATQQFQKEIFKDPFLFMDKKILPFPSQKETVPVECFNQTIVRLLEQFEQGKMYHFNIPFTHEFVKLKTHQTRDGLMVTFSIWNINSV